MEDVTVLVVIAVIAQAIISGVLASNLAQKKGYSSGAWFVCGFFFGIFGLIAASGLPLRPDLQQTGGALIKKCPQCAELIKIESRVCRYCWQKFGKEEIIKELGIILDEDATSRIQAIEVLAEMGDEAVIPYLEKALSYASYSEDSEVQAEASQALLNIGTIPAMISVLGKGGYREKEKATEILKERADPSAIQGLLSIVEGGFPEDARFAAISVLAKIKDESVIPALIGALADKDLRDEATEGLIRMGDPAIPYLEEAIKQQRKSIGKHAERIIVKIKHNERGN